jgi:uncharacterized protein
MHDETASALRLEHLTPGPALLDVAGDFLAAHEAEHSLLLGMAGSIRDHPARFDGAYLAVVRDRAPRFVAIRTPGFQLMLSLADDPAAIDLVADDVVARPDRPPGVSGPIAVVRRFVDRWQAGGGPAAKVEQRTRTYRLDAVVPPSRPPAGHARVARRDDADLLARWVTAFEAEALPHLVPGEPASALVARWLDDPTRILWLWEAAGRPVSMAVCGGLTPHGRRIGTVYTPPDNRRRGYAGALVAAASQAELDGGRRFCFLDTDLDNPTSNAVYEAIGYRAMSDGEWYGFTPG